MTVDLFPAHPHAWSVALQLVCIAAVTMSAGYAWRQARRAGRIERAEEDARVAARRAALAENGHPVALARSAHRLESARALAAEIDGWPPVAALLEPGVGAPIE